MTTINGYRLHGELSAQNAGFSRWAFCEKGGHEYYIKEFLAPVYPDDASGLSQDKLTRKRKLCDDFYAKKRAFYDTLQLCRTGNNAIVHDFFRFGSKFYSVTERVYTAGLGVSDIAALEQKQRETLIRALLFSVASLHEHGIVHADLKPDNILLKQTKRGYVTTKVVDFDASFLVDDVPAELQGDFVYLAPEVYLHMREQPASITEKIDVFALGLLIHQYWTGELPGIDPAYKYAFQAVLKGSEPIVNENMPAALRQAVARALAFDPTERPSARELLMSCGGSDTPELVIENDPVIETVRMDPAEDVLNHRHGFYVPDTLG